LPASVGDDESVVKHQTSFKQ